MAENFIHQTNSGFGELVFWLDQVKLDENSELGSQVSLEILLGKLCKHMAETGEITADPRYGQFNN